MEKKQLIKRSYLCEVREKEDEAGVIEGIPIVYDSETDLGWFREKIQKGALDKTDLTDVRFLVNHDLSKIPLARSRNNNENSTMQLQVKNDGLHIRAKLDIENNTEAKSLYSAIKRGDVSGMSFLFSADGEEWEELDSDSPLRTITSISSIVEVSAVTVPAYEDTEIYARSKEELESYKRTLDSVKEKRVGALDSVKQLELAKAKNKNLLI